jgi:hypothetical protein
MNSYFSKGLFGFCSSMGVYGVSRGYRAQNKYNTETTETETLTSEKITKSIFNGFFYAIPVANIVPIIRLFNRLEIDYKGLNPNDYKDNYREYVGNCEDVI